MAIAVVCGSRYGTEIWDIGHNTVGMINLTIIRIQVLCGTRQINVLFGIEVVGGGLGCGSASGRGHCRGCSVVGHRGGGN